MSWAACSCQPSTSHCCRTGCCPWSSHWKTLHYHASQKSLGFFRRSQRVRQGFNGSTPLRPLLRCQCCCLLVSPEPAQRDRSLPFKLNLSLLLIWPRFPWRCCDHETQAQSWIDMVAIASMDGLLNAMTMAIIWSLWSWNISGLGAQTRSCDGATSSTCSPPGRGASADGTCPECWHASELDAKTCEHIEIRHSSNANPV